MALYRPGRKPGWWQEIPATDHMQHADDSFDETEVMRLSRLGRTSVGTSEMADGSWAVEMPDGSVRTGSLDDADIRSELRNKLHTMKAEQEPSRAMKARNRAEPRDAGQQERRTMSASEERPRKAIRAGMFKRLASESIRSNRPRSDECQRGATEEGHPSRDVQETSETKALAAPATPPGAYLLAAPCTPPGAHLRQSSAMRPRPSRRPAP